MCIHIYIYMFRSDARSSPMPAHQPLPKLKKRNATRAKTLEGGLAQSPILLM